ncbi:hypothetical protein B1694_10480 [Geobacillus zalihae]|nr:hypothetical protein B1694_10480 [Geobacillus zalihae]
MSNLLFDDQPLVILPQLALAIFEGAFPTCVSTEGGRLIAIFRNENKKTLATQGFDQWSIPGSNR